MANPGSDVFVIDDPLSGAEAAATDTLYLLNTLGPAVPEKARRANTGVPEIDAQLRAYFLDGGKTVTVAGYQTTPTTKPSLTAAIRGLPDGPGQVVAPEVQTSTPAITVATEAWKANKVALLGGPESATDQQLATLATAIINGGDARGAALFADTAIQPGLVSSDTDNVPWAVTVAALIARSDRITGNPNIAAAGKRGISRAKGVTDLRDNPRRETLKDAQVNAAKIVLGSLRNYGYRTLADLDVLEHWWDLSGSRTVMAFRAMAATINEDYIFDQIDGQGVLLGKYEAALRKALMSLYMKGALYGESPTEAYSVDVGEEVNPLEEIQAGEVGATVRLKTSPYPEHITTNIVRRSLAAAL